MDQAAERLKNKEKIAIRRGLFIAEGLRFIREIERIGRCLRMR